MEKNMVGAYGEWLAKDVLGDGPAEMSFRGGKYKTLAAWRKAAKAKVIECIAPVDLGGTPEAQVESKNEYEGVDVEHLSWQLPMGPRTEAVFLKPQGAKRKLPGILALHDHGGNKFLGWRKITRTDDEPWRIQAEHQKHYYGGVGWATEIAKRGYAVLVHDTFPFASRRVRVSDMPEQLKCGGVDPEPDDLEGIGKYNQFAGLHEHIMEKSLISAGTTWPGVYVTEDMRALDVLCARPEVDRKRVGCGGLSGGGMRTVYLAGLDERIKCSVSVGFMTTWCDFVLNKCWTHTWMAYAPLLPKYMDFPEIYAVRCPKATMVQLTTEDQLYTLPEMKRADKIMAEVFGKAGAGEMYQGKFYPGPHKFDLEMQRDAFAWFDEHLK